VSCVAPYAHRVRVPAAAAAEKLLEYARPARQHHDVHRFVGFQAGGLPALERTTRVRPGLHSVVAFCPSASGREGSRLSNSVPPIPPLGWRRRMRWSIHPFAAASGQRDMVRAGRNATFSVQKSVALHAKPKLPKPLSWLASGRATRRNQGQRSGLSTGSNEMFFPAPMIVSCLREVQQPRSAIRKCTG